MQLEIWLHGVFTGTKGDESQWRWIGKSAMDYRKRGLWAIIEMTSCCGQAFQGDGAWSRVSMRACINCRAFWRHDWWLLEICDDLRSVVRLLKTALRELMEGKREKKEDFSLAAEDNCCPVAWLPLCDHRITCSTSEHAQRLLSLS